MMFNVGDKVAYGNSWKGWVVSSVSRTTAKTAFLENGDRVRLSDGQVATKGFLAKPYEDVAGKVEEWSREQAAKNRLSRSKSLVSDIYDRMRRNYFDGFTADELDKVAFAMQDVIDSKNARKSHD